MDALDALLNRVSAPRLEEPGPTPEQLDRISRAALRAADHGQLRPWRFLLVHGDARKRLGDLFVNAALAANPDLTREERGRIRVKPLRAPMIIVVIAHHVAHPKIPRFEQDLSAGAAAQNMLNAAHALGLGAMWRTGAVVRDPHFKSDLGIAGNEKIIGMIYLGTVSGKPKTPPKEDPADFFAEWQP
ncbi:MAG: nitroreductase [Gammaproteobacteria bacterium]|nr:nitroreductase [Gammaproteobacteria bacterium]